MVELRNWQKQARQQLRKAIHNDDKVFLVEAGIGSGKTIAALISAKDAIDSKKVARIIVVTFTSHLVSQWGKAASTLELNLLECEGNGSLKDGFPIDAEGYITTFASVGSNADIHESLCTNIRTLVIIDEIHHLGEEDGDEVNEAEMTLWAKQADAAFKAASMVLCLSGTPYRTDKKHIPFVNYNPHPYKDLYQLKSDVTYSYGESVFDEICRRVVFKRVDGDIDLTIHTTENGVTNSTRKVVKFADDIDRSEYHERLTAAIKIDNPYDPAKMKNRLVIELMREAINRLNDLRLSNNRAGGLIIADNKEHARQLSALIHTMTGREPILVLEDVPKATKLIETFRDGDSPWIVSVKMITEGVDIPRLQVCVYLAAKTAWLYVVQVIGRIVRNPPGQSYFYCFPDPRIERIIKEIEKELEIWLRKKRKGPDGPGPGIQKIIELNEAVGDNWSGVVAGEPVTEAEMQQIDIMRKAMPALTEEDYLALLKMVRKTGAERQQKGKPEESPSPPGMSYSQKRDHLRKRIQKAVGRYHQLRSGMAHNDIHTMLNKEVGARSKNSASIEQLDHMMKIIEERIASVGEDAVKGMVDALNALNDEEEL